MCGIFGHTRLDAATRDLDHSRQCLHSLAHRGPDDWSEWVDDAIYLGHRRLSIIDLSPRGRQPMADSDGRTVVSVNGEIYNFRELRAELAETVSFSSDSDSEVVLHGFNRWGIEGLVARLEGMFAVAIYDRANRAIHLVRDRVGIKPLFWSRVRGGLAWASELKALERLHAADLTVDGTAAYDFLTYQYIPSPKTLYRDVHKLEAAHRLEFRLVGNTCCCHRYWSLSTEPRAGTEEATSEELRQLVSEAVQAQLVSDVPVGFFLSGGFDSSVVVAEAHRAGVAARTFSIGFDDPAHDETHFAELVARSLGTDHVTDRVALDRGLELFARLRGWFDEPFGDTSAIPTFWVSSCARQHVTVALTGDGGDEVFGGYRWYARFDEQHRPHRPGAALVRPLTDAVRAFAGRRLVGRAAARVNREWFLDDLELYTTLMGGLLASEKRAYRAQWSVPSDYDDYWAFRRYYRPELDLYTRLQYLDFHTYLPDDILTKVDRVSMAVALECRVPLLATRLVEFLFSVPSNIRLADGTLKGLAKHAYRGILPDAILDRDKKGFSIPMRSWGSALLQGIPTRQETILAQLFPELVSGMWPRTSAS